MTAYEQGFLTKCASYGIPEEQAFYMMKLARTIYYNKKGYDSDGRPLSKEYPVLKPTKENPMPWMTTDPVEAGITAIPPSARAQQAQKPAQQAPAPKPAPNPAAKPAPQLNEAASGYEPNNPFAPNAASQNQQAGLPGPQAGITAGNAAQASAAGNSWARYGQNGPDPNDPRTAAITGSNTGPQWKDMDMSAKRKLITDNGMTVKDYNALVQSKDPAKLRQARDLRNQWLQNYKNSPQQQQAATQQPKPFQPNEQQQKLQTAWDKMTPQGQAQNLGRIGITQEQFDAYSPQQKYDAMDKMRSAWMKAKQNAGSAGQSKQPAKPASGSVSSSSAGRTAPAEVNEPYTFPNGDVWDKQTGTQMDRASYDRLMAARAGKGKINGLTPQQIQQNQLNAIGQGWRNQYAEQEERMAQTRARQPRDARGNLQTINLAGRATNPYSSRPGVRGIRPAVGS